MTDHSGIDAELEQRATAYLLDPSDPACRDRFVARFAGLVPLPWSMAVGEALDLAAEDDAVELLRLVPATGGAMRQRPHIAEALQLLDQKPGLEAGAVTNELYGALSRPVLMRLLVDVVFAHDDVEALLTALRRIWLLASVADHQIIWPSLDLLAAVGLQMHNTEWVFDETGAESDAIVDLERRLRDPGTAATTELYLRDWIVYACYRSPSSVRAPHTSGLAEGGTVFELVRRHLEEPAEEHRLAAGLQRLTPIADPLSIGVKSQYEAAPYPRWRSPPPARSSRPPGDVVADAIGRPDLRGCSVNDRPRILVAGCGTGRHAILAANRYANAQVLAIDLSLASLGFAARQARRLGVGNIVFAQADILEMGGLSDRFDVIECSGVLHHLREPEEGWRILRDLLTSGGLMKLGLYSARGRSALDAVRERIGSEGIQPTTDGVRAIRRMVRRLPEEEPARQMAVGPDFYSMSGCRDMFFNVHEDPFDLPRIERGLGSLDLEFLGFELADRRIQTLYERHFPDDPAAVDLRNWTLIEQRYRYMFATMYRFWSRSRR